MDDILPAIVKRIKEEDLNVVWVCDPMHGNTYQTECKSKTRSVVAIMTEISKTHQILKDRDCHLAGIHLELVGTNVTECVDGVDELTHEDLNTCYTTYCDPRLNFIQSLEVVNEFCKLN